MLLVDLSQIVTAIVTTAGVIWSLYYSRTALVEVRKDRLLSRLPFLLFDYDLGYIGMICYKRSGEDYTNNSASLLPYPRSETSVMTVGQLKNYGAGPAINIKIIWVAQTVITSSFPDGIESDQSGAFAQEKNETDVHSPHIDAGQITGIHTIPYFIHMDAKHEISKVKGCLIIRYQDTLGNQYETRQGFELSPNYEKEFLAVSFLNLISTTSSKV